MRVILRCAHRFDGLSVCESTIKHERDSGVGDNTIANLEIKSPLLPDRMRQPDFFVCDIFDAAPKGDIASMEHPIFSVATKPDLKSRRYQNGALWLEVKPSGEGLATVHDRDILIYCISQNQFHRI